ncbi:hypothetical protein CALCODRAFT_504752 [Calocera cornea HHB12733]|uniref:Uncharacterized protein n=1 Tax=Calocera cornea HHB12733 TaxID=1353952 RepID=A0A165C981_9BASI|nr:hypothetical protein CALCODRAFT_504752 [Calocera cornea HHB12733]
MHQQRALRLETVFSTAQMLLGTWASALEMGVQDQGLWGLIESARAKFERVYDAEDRTRFMGHKIRQMVPIDVLPPV